MNIKQVLTVWKKEVKDTVRDRRTLMSMLILPIVLMPALIVGVSKFTLYQTSQANKQTSKIAFANPKNAPEFVSFMERQDKISVVNVEDLQTAVKNKKIDAGIEIPSNFNSFLTAQKPVTLNVLHNTTNTADSTVLSRLTSDIALFNNSLLAERFRNEKINPSILVGVSISPTDVATEQERGGFFLGFIIPLFIVMWSIIGGQYTAIDVSAGEKERKTLESLLMTPISRLSLVAGKFLAVSTASLISVVASLSSLYFAVKYSGLTSTVGLNTGSARSALGNLNLSLDPQALVLILIVSILLVLMFSALILSLGIFAKSYREAQSYISPAYIVVILPIVLVNSIPSFSPSNWFFAIPAINAVLLFKELLIGTYDLAHIGISIASLIVFSILAIFVATIIYSKENILFKD